MRPVIKRPIFVLGPPSLLITTILLFLSITTQIVARMKALRESLRHRIIQIALVVSQLEIFESAVSSPRDV